MTPNHLSANAIREIIDFRDVRVYHHINALKGLFSVALEWLMIIAAVVICERFFSWPLYVLTVVVIGARFLALGLIMHEGVHGLITKNKTINYWVSEIFCAWPLFISMRSYRVKHLAHHAWLNTDKDPDYTAKNDVNWQYPMTVAKFLKIAFLQLSGIGVFETFRVMSGAKVKKPKKRKTPVWYHLVRLSFYVIVIGSFVLADQGMLLVWYWIIPYATWTQFANRLRRVAEHSAIEDKVNDMQTRTTIHSWLGRFLLAPKFISYHNEHHLYPGVPCYNLPKLHEVLVSNATVKEELHISKSYKEVYGECIQNTKAEAI